MSELSSSPDGGFATAPPPQPPVLRDRLGNRLSERREFRRRVAAMYELMTGKKMSSRQWRRMRRYISRAEMMKPV